VRRGFGGWGGGAVEDVEGSLRHRLVGVGKEDADLPQLGVAELRFEGRHPGEADAVEDFPVGLAERVVADADDLGVVMVGLE